MSLVQSCIPETQTVAPLLKFSFIPGSRTLSCFFHSRQQGRLKNNAELIVKTCASEISTITVGESGVIPVKQLRENTITSLDLSNKGLGVDGALILAALIKDNTSVQQLHAQNNGLGPEGAKYFGSMLEHNNTLTLLDVSGNQMKAKGAAALAGGLKANTGVQQLNASSNSLGPEGAMALAASIAENSTITSVRTLFL